MSEMITIDTSKPTAIKVELGNVLELVPETCPSLKKPTLEFVFDENSLKEAETISNDLIKTLKNNKAFGLAANQCGIPYSALAFGYGEQFFTMFNPKIVYASEETVMMQEGCLSFPFLVLNVNRPNKIKVEFQDSKGLKLTQPFEGLSARIIQHEIDHLNGITFDTLAKPLALKAGIKKRDKNMKRYARAIVSQRRASNG